MRDRLRGGSGPADTHGVLLMVSRWKISLAIRGETRNSNTTVSIQLLVQTTSSSLYWVYKNNFRAKNQALSKPPRAREGDEVSLSNRNLCEYARAYRCVTLFCNVRMYRSSNAQLGYKTAYNCAAKNSLSSALSASSFWLGTAVSVIIVIIVVMYRRCARPPFSERRKRLTSSARAPFACVEEVSASIESGSPRAIHRRRLLWFWRGPPWRDGFTDDGW